MSTGAAVGDDFLLRPAGNTGNHEYMPTTEFKCRRCGHIFQRLTLEGDEGVNAPCPKCSSRDVKPEVRSPRLFDGIAGFSNLAKDTN